MNNDRPPANEEYFRGVMATEAEAIPFGDDKPLPPPVSEPSESQSDAASKSPANGQVAQAAASDEESRRGLRTRGVLLERVRPVRWLWARRIPMGLPSILVGEEGVGKGTAAAWLVARATRGELGGDLHGEPVRVLILGDEDGFEPIWVPRIYAAGGDLDMLRTLDDREYLDDLHARADDLAATVKDEGIGLLLFDQLLDHIAGGSNGEAIYNPKNVRQAMLPLRRVAGELGVAALGLLHPIKGNVSSFRQLVAGSHQLNAVSRSSLLLAADPDDEDRRVLVRGKGNHTTAPRSFEFAIAGEVVELNAHAFEVPKVVDEHEGERTVRDLLNATPASPVRDELAEQLGPLLTDEPQALADLARAVDRDPKDRMVRKALAWLSDEGRAEKDERGKWHRPAEGVGVLLSSRTPDTPSDKPNGQDELERLLEEHADIAGGEL